MKSLKGFWEFEVTWGRPAVSHLSSVSASTSQDRQQRPREVGPSQKLPPHNQSFTFITEPLTLKLQETNQSRGSQGRGRGPPEDTAAATTEVA